MKKMAKSNTSGFPGSHSAGSRQLPGPLPAALRSSSSRRLPLSPGEKISSTGRSGRGLPRARRSHRASASSQGHPLPASERGGTAVACLSGFENPRAPSNAIKQVRRIAWNRCLQHMVAARITPPGPGSKLKCDYTGLLVWVRESPGSQNRKS